MASSSSSDCLASTNSYNFYITSQSPPDAAAARATRAVRVATGPPHMVQRIGSGSVPGA